MCSWSEKTRRISIYVESTYTYNSAGQVTSVTDPMGGVTGYECYSLNRLTAVVSPVQTKTEYTYNARGLLARANAMQARMENNVLQIYMRIH